MAAIVKSVTKATARQTSATAVKAAIDRALQADSNPVDQWRPLIYPNNWKACQAAYSNSHYGGDTEMVVTGCGSTAIGLYMLYKHSGVEPYRAALKTLVAYVWTRPDFNGAHQANREIIGLIKSCQRFAGDTWQPCTIG